MSESSAVRTYKAPMPAGWWTRKGHYFWYIVREFTALPMALWLLWLLFEVQSASTGQQGYSPPHALAFVIFSVIVFLSSLYHSVTFLSLAGVIISVKLFDKPVPARLIVLSQFGLWALASIVIGAALIWFAR